MVADLCHVVLSPFRGEKAKRRHAKTRQMVTFSCFRMATFHPATRKYAAFHALRFRPLFVVSLPGGAKGRHAKSPFGGFSRGDLSRFRPCLSYLCLARRTLGRHAKTRQNHHLAGFRVATFRVFAPKTRLYDMAQISHHKIILLISVEFNYLLL